MQNPAVIFDLDNTLVDRRKSLMTFTDKLIEKYCIIDEYGRDKITKEVIKADQDGYRSKDEIYSDLIKILSWRITPQMKEFNEYWNDEFPNCTELMKGTLEILEMLKSRKIKLGIITNGKSMVQNKKIDRVNIRHYFDCIHISEEVGFKKPEPEIFHLTLCKLGVTAQDAYYIGDHPVNDIMGAHKTGIKAIWFEGFFDWDSNATYQPFATINKLNDLLEIIIV